jgi:hypothetical protein
MFALLQDLLSKDGKMGGRFVRDANEYRGSDWAWPQARELNHEKDDAVLLGMES